MMACMSASMGARRPPSRQVRPWAGPAAHFAGLLAFTLAVPGHDLRAAGRGDEVVVVYNRRVAPDSRLVAEHYAAARQVPPEQVIGLTLPETESMTRAEYRDQLEKPLLRELQARKLITFKDELIPATNGKPAEVGRKPVQARVRYLALCYGVPARIIRDPTLVEPNMDKLAPELRRNEAAVDSELAALPRSEFRFGLYGPAANHLYGATNAAWLTPTNGILLVSRLDGPTAAIALELVDKALSAETNGLWGRAYFDARGLTNGAYKIGDDWIKAAYQLARRQGFDCVLDDKPDTFPPAFPMSQIALYAGWYEGNACGPFARPTVEFMPGAIAYHLHSYSATTIRSPTMAWVGPLLTKGAAATMGAVDEPYLEGTPDLGVFFARLLHFGFTFAEAAYAAQTAVSWQMTIIGDPLYRPFGWKPKELHEELDRRHSPLIEWSHLRVVNLNLVTDLPAQELVSYLEQLPVTKQSAILEQRLGELYLGLGKASDGAEAYVRALRLKPSPQQRVHLQLAAGSLLGALEKEQDALELYQALLRENTDYPDMPAVYARMLPLARRVNDAALVEKCERESRRVSGGK